MVASLKKPGDVLAAILVVVFLDKCVVNNQDSVCLLKQKPSIAQVRVIWLKCLRVSLWGEHSTKNGKNIKKKLVILVDTNSSNCFTDDGFPIVQVFSFRVLVSLGFFFDVKH